MKKIKMVVVLAILGVILGGAFTEAHAQNDKFAIILQAGKKSHEGMARALHAFLYAKELKEKGYDVVLIFDGAGTEWAEELSDPESDSKLLGAYKAFKETGTEEIICDYCAVAFDVKDDLLKREASFGSGYQGHPSIAKWVEKGYRLVIL